jgi:hypothetical protein
MCSIQKRGLADWPQEAKMALVFIKFAVIYMKLCRWYLQENNGICIRGPTAK